jgi:Asp-tRNA(Asn)/Glu-tRNA(Gln) amidotransferase A subunit family amidase
MTTRSTGRHTSALRKTLRELPAEVRTSEAALIELAKSLAEQLDAVAPDMPARLTAEYRGSLSGLRRAAAAAKASGAQPGPVGKLAELRALAKGGRVA